MELYPHKAKLEPYVFLLIMIIPAVVILFVILQYFHLLNRAEYRQSMAEKMGNSIEAPQGVEQIQVWGEKDKQLAEWCGYYRSLYATDQSGVDILAKYRQVFNDRDWAIHAVDPQWKDKILSVQNVDEGYYISVVLCNTRQLCTYPDASQRLEQALRTYATVYILQVIYRPPSMSSCGA